MDLEGLPPTLTVEHAGAVLGLSRRTAYRAAERGEIPTFRIGRRLMVPTAKLLAMLGVTQDPTVPHVSAQALTPTLTYELPTSGLVDGGELGVEPAR